MDLEVDEEEGNPKVEMEEFLDRPAAMFGDQGEAVMVGTGSEAPPLGAIVVEAN